MGTRTALGCERKGLLWVHIDNVNKRSVMSIPSTGYVDLPRQPNSVHPLTDRGWGLRVLRRREVCPSVHSPHDLAYVAARRRRRRDDRSDPVLRGQAPVVPDPAGSFGQTRGGQVVGCTQARSL